MTRAKPRTFPLWQPMALTLRLLSRMSEPVRLSKLTSAPVSALPATSLVPTESGPRSRAVRLSLATLPEPTAFVASLLLVTAAPASSVAFTSPFLMSCESSDSSMTSELSMVFAAYAVPPATTPTHAIRAITS